MFRTFTAFKITSLFVLIDLWFLNRIPGHRNIILKEVYLMYLVFVIQENASLSAGFWEESVTVSLPCRRCSGICTHQKEGDMQEGWGTKFSLLPQSFSLGLTIF